ncbi:hypothetical protein F2Q70_00016953 [Brassica cretica]|uniref:Uncharacterized protein n=1 Tax=Brassica cretica TaxID=69181 RepID=A0A8S9HWF8_BRACR|nr:hypothetical protein F2Q70_00016953 [Brassica cretica]
MSVDGRRVSSVDGGGECRSTRLVSGSTVADENRATNKCCCRSMRNVFLCGLNAPSFQDLMRIAVDFPCCFWSCWACTWKDKKKNLCQKVVLRRNLE